MRHAPRELCCYVTHAPGRVRAVVGVWDGRRGAIGCGTVPTPMQLGNGRLSRVAESLAQAKAYRCISRGVAGAALRMRDQRKARDAVIMSKYAAREAAKHEREARR